MRAFWQPYLNTITPTLFVYGTPMFVRVDRMLFRDTRLNRPDEIGKNENLDRMTEAFHPEEIRPSFKFTGVGEADSLFLLTRILTEQRVNLSVKRASNLRWDELKGRNVVLIGSQKYIPRIPEFPFKQKFEADRGKVTNLAPAPGEQVEYPNLFRDKFGEALETYAVISVYPGLEPHTRLLMLSCSSNEGTGGAAEYVTRPDTLRELFQQMKLPAQPALPKAFQAVIRVKLNEGVPVQLSYVTHHLLAQ